MSIFSESSEKKIPSPLDKQRTTDYLFTTRKRKDPDLPGLPCSFFADFKIENLDIVHERGRAKWETITYSPDQIYNYGSQSERYDEAANLIPSYVTPQASGSTIYGFCSPLASIGFWEVTVGGSGGASFITLSPPAITILCPRPFLLSEFITATSDTTTYLWTQIAGSRTVLITPPNVQYPTIDIQASCFTSGCDSNTQSPIILRVETDNSLVFADLVIFNRPTDFFYALGYLGIVNTDITERAVSVLYRVPNRTQEASVWVGEDINLTWLVPSIDSEFIVSYRFQQFIPPYTDQQILLPADPRLVTVEANERYRIATDFLIFGTSSTSFSSPPIYYGFPQVSTDTIYADDSCASSSFAYILSVSDTVFFGVQVRDVQDTATGVLGFAYIFSAWDTASFGVQVRDVQDAAVGVLGFAFLLADYEKVDLGGIVIG